MSRNGRTAGPGTACNTPSATLTAGAAGLLPVIAAWLSRARYIALSEGDTEEDRLTKKGA